MTLSDMANHVVELIGSPDTESIAQAKKLWVHHNTPALIAEYRKLVEQQQGLRQKSQSNP